MVLARACYDAAMKNSSRVACSICLLMAAMAGRMASAADAPEKVARLAGQRMFLADSLALCRERVPALRQELDAAFSRGEAVIQKAESIIGAEVGARDQMHLEAYSQAWLKTARDLVVALQKQKASDACPTLVENWLNAEAETLVEDWHIYLERKREETP